VIHNFWLIDSRSRKTFRNIDRTIGLGYRAIDFETWISPPSV
jgi:hypothetical protein